MKNYTWMLILMGIGLLTFGGGYHLREVSLDQGPPLVKSNDGHLFTARRLDLPARRLQLDPDLSRKEFWVRWITRLEHTPLDKMIELAYEAGEDTQLLRILAITWVTRDREHFLRTLIEYQDHKNFIEERPLAISDLSDLFTELVIEKNPQESLLLMQGFPDSKMVQDFKFAILWERSKENLLGAIDLATEWKFDRIDFRPDLVKKQALKTPELLIAKLLKHRETMSLRKRSQIDRHFKTIGTEMMKANAASRMDFAMTQEDTLLLAAFDSWVEKDIDAAISWFENKDHLSDKHQQKFRLSLLKKWGKEDSPAALLWTEENLVGQERQSALVQLLVTAGKEQPQAAITLFDTIHSGEDKQAVVAELTMLLFPQNDYISGEIVHPLSQEALAWIQSLDDSKMLAEAMRIAQGRWATIDAEGLEKFLSSEKGQQLPAESFLDLANTKAFSDPEGATTWANEFEGEKRNKIAARVFDTWLDQAADQAVNWFAKLPVDDPRHRLLSQELIQTIRPMENPEPLLKKLSPEQRVIIEHGGSIFDLHGTFEEQLREAKEKKETSLR